VKKKARKQTKQQILLGIHLRELGLQTVPELVFGNRHWRFDLSCDEHRLAFEISGGNWTGGHRRGKAQEDEYDKLNTAQMQGWRVLQFTNAQVEDGRAKEFVKGWLTNGPSGG
jgi:very-short-patch-repair endonuclease